MNNNVLIGLIEEMLNNMKAGHSNITEEGQLELIDTI
jgi:hypothetical protein